MSVIPLESNPDVINKFLANLGVPDKWKVTDVYGLDDDMLAIVPRPVLSLILLFPDSKMYGGQSAKDNTDIERNNEKVSSKLFYMKQYLHNACGTVAVIHSIANNLEKIKLNDGYLKQFLSSSVNLTPEERGKLLQNHEGIIEAHKAIAEEGQTAPPEAEGEVNYHFIAFVCVDGLLYELDGDKSSPVVHGASSSDTLLEDAAKVVKDFIARDPKELHFTLLALSPAVSD